jgi:hypothetical protein
MKMCDWRITSLCGHNLSRSIFNENVAKLNENKTLESRQ